MSGIDKDKNAFKNQLLSAIGEENLDEIKIAILLITSGVNLSKLNPYI